MIGTRGNEFAPWQFGNISILIFQKVGSIYSSGGEGEKSRMNVRSELLNREHAISLI